MYDDITLREALKKEEKYLIKSLMKRHKGNITRVAEELGISRPTVYDLLNKYKLPIKINRK
jgi:two-component system NtrC family response regulator